MKKIIFFSVFLFVFNFSCFAQLEMGLNITRRSYISYEPIEAELTIVNNSGRQLIFGSTLASGGLEIQIIDKNKNIIRPFKKDMNPVAGLILGSGETRRLKLNLNSKFPLARANKYRVRSVLRHNSISGSFVTGWKEFSVNKAYSIEKRSFGVSLGEGKSKIHYYEVVGYSQESGDIYCLKIYDDKLLYAFHRIGPKVRGIKLEHDVDAFGNIHVLVQLKPKLFHYKVYTSKGKLKQLRKYQATFESVPNLVRDLQLGKVSVVGGIVLSK